MLKIDNISKYYFSGNNVVLALRKINLEFHIGEFIAITGESGSGKSTLLNVLSGLDTYEEGKLFVNGRDISHYTIDELEHYRKDYIGFVFQDYNIIDSYTVLQNVELALTVMGYPKEQKRKRALELIERVGLTKVKDQKAIKLSGGEKQRTVIARTLAKDCKILVCDEPTGNLDKESSKQIFKLLKEISLDKLVIVVTHDFKKLEGFATRKIRLYDGEIVEDNITNKQKINKNIKISSKKYFTRFADILKISYNNVLSVPKKSLFTLLTIVFMIGIVFFVYGGGIIEKNRPYSDTTPYFENAHESRIIVTKHNGEAFTDTELFIISQVEYVQEVIENDSVFDLTLLNKVYNEEFQMFDFYEYQPLSSAALDEFDLIEGRLPEDDFEVVISNNGFYQINEFIELANSFLLYGTQDVELDQFTYKVVGIVDDIPTNTTQKLYFNKDGLEKLAEVSVFNNSEVSINIVGTTLYDTPNETWITPDIDDSVEIDDRTYNLIYSIWIDNTLNDNEILTFDMMYFDICRDFDFKKELRLDEDAGLCDARDFIDSHDITFSAITTFENELKFDNITFLSFADDENDKLQKLYMNEFTFSKYFTEDAYQVTAVVSDTFEGKEVVNTLNSLGFNVFYPSQVIPQGETYKVVLYNIGVTIIVILASTVIFFVGYFVIRNIIVSKLKDYLILRSIGTSKKSIRNILQMEIGYITLIGTVIIILFFLIISNFDTPVPNILSYYSFGDYIFVLVMILIVLELMIFSFTKKIFEVSVISSLKGIEK